ncbi:MAG: GDP-mannose 4,6-dehydratase [Candidatus Heimdallarchaeota archaeon]|nr:GDP-mannose 4,6-dehydratase [Candidatus Heimdallarchaeota archaeon]MCK4876393.1 GDP-mannose 4,6-dehydratase [Candidatus Heimdallarchaeota archaeon]
MSEHKETVLITGGLGQIGYYTYLQLKEKYQICILDNMLDSKINPPADVIFIKGDIRDQETYSLLPKVEHIIHCAAQISIAKSTVNPILDAETNILGTLNLLEFSRKKNIDRFVFISSAATYGNPQFLPITEEHPRNPLSPYGMSKLVAEKYVSLYSDLFGLNSITLLPFNIYSPLQKEDDPYAGVIFKFIKTIKNNQSPIIEGDGNQTRDFVHIKDITAAIELALENKHITNKTINIGSGEPTTILELANLLVQISGKELELVHKEPREGDIRESFTSLKLAKELLNYSPQIKLKDGLKDMYDSLLV